MRNHISTNPLEDKAKYLGVMITGELDRSIHINKYSKQIDAVASSKEALRIAYKISDTICNYTYINFA